MRPRVVLSLWVLVGAAVWNGFFDLHVSRGAREYLQRQAEFETGRGPQPAMDEVMGRAKQSGAMAATIWGTVVVLGGWGMYVAGRRARRDQVRS